MGKNLYNSDLPKMAEISYETFSKKMHETIVRVCGYFGTSFGQIGHNVIGVDLVGVEHRMFAVSCSENLFPYFFSILQLKQIDFLENLNTLQSNFICFYITNDILL